MNEEEIRAHPIEEDRDYGHLEGRVLVRCYAGCPWFDQYEHGVFRRYRILTRWERVEEK